MSEWDSSEWEKPYINKYRILVLDPGRIVAVMPLRTDENTCWVINAGIKEVAKEHIVKSITSVQEKTFEGISHTTEVILIVEQKVVGQ